VDDCDECNGDGVAERGEKIQLVVDVTNTGTGKALDADASIKNAADQNIFIEKGRFRLGEMAPGETKTARFMLEVKKGYVGNTFPLKLAVVDGALEEFSAEKLELPVLDRPLDVEQRHGTVKLSDNTDLLAAPQDKAAALAHLPHGAVLSSVGRVGAYDKVELDKSRFVWVRATDAKEAPKAHPSAPQAKDLQYVLSRSPPQISLSVDPAQGGIVATGDRYTLSGTATDPRGLLDLYVLVNDQKVFFRTADPGKGVPDKMKFTTDFPLKDGNNFVMVVARQTPEFASKQMLVIRKRPSALASKAVSVPSTQEVSTP
jgi:carboxyl-terminal processing protease